MITKPTRQRIKFKELTIGQRFYDPISAEYFVKQSDELAAMVTGIGDGTVPDEFEADDVVGIDQELQA
jgi:hypothetical protein